MSILNLSDDAKNNDALEEQLASHKSDDASLSAISGGDEVDRPIDKQIKCQNCGKLIYVSGIKYHRCK